MVSGVLCRAAGVRSISESLVSEEQVPFTEGRGCLVFALLQVAEIFLKKKNGYDSLLDIEKACDKVNRRALWRVLTLYDASGRLSNALKKLL